MFTAETWAAHCHKVAAEHRRIATLALVPDAVSEQLKLAALYDKYASEFTPMPLDPLFPRPVFVPDPIPGGRQLTEIPLMASGAGCTATNSWSV